MKYKIFSLDENGRISFTKEELEKLLDEVYDDGYSEGSKKYVYCYPTTYTEPYNPNKPYITYLSQDQSSTSVSTVPITNIKGE